MMVKFLDNGQGYFYFAELDKSAGSLNLVKSSTRRLPVANHLTDVEYDIFLGVYARHNASIGLEYRDKYSIANVIKVDSLVTDKIIAVYWSDEWWHYSIDGTWY